VVDAPLDDVHLQPATAGMFTAPRPSAAESDPLPTFLAFGLAGFLGYQLVRQVRKRSHPGWRGRQTGTAAPHKPANVLRMQAANQVTHTGCHGVRMCTRACAPPLDWHRRPAQGQRTRAM